MKDRILNGLMLAVVAAALLLTWLKGVPDTGEPLPISALTAPTATTAPHQAEVYRTRRAQERQMEQTLLNTLIQSDSVAPETKELAEAQLLSVTARTELELAVEAAFAAHGYVDALCVAQDGSITLFLPASVTQEEAAFFLALAQDASGLGAENIRLTGFS